MSFFIELGLMIGIIILASAAAKHFFSPARQRPRQHARHQREESAGDEAAKLRYKERTEAREMYERLVREKLAVVKDAIAMGYSEVELSKLDRRLAELIGEDELKNLISAAPEAPLPNADLLDTDLLNEVEKLRSKQKEQ
jgi:hypothetical protein